MKRFLVSLCSLAFALSFIQADCASVTPPTQECPTKTQSVTYEAAGSCGARGVITILVPVAGECAISVIENQSVQLPTTGQFTPAASETGYELTKGNWTLAPLGTGMLGDAAGSSCAITRITPEELDLTCTITECSVVGDDSEPTCRVSGSCETHLTAAPAGAMPDLDASTGMDAGAAAVRDGGLE